MKVLEKILLSLTMNLIATQSAFSHVGSRANTTTLEMNEHYKGTELRVLRFLSDPHLC